MGKNRDKQKANKRKYRQEESLNSLNEFNVKDLTPMTAVENIRKENNNEK